ncbi:MAG: flagellar M-ring protein FliF [Candidatus Hydrogenedentes bacterium]|nr:flagellar M-ring protein FliF [Candidatus Hydrogenedentota bacterium]
MEFLRQILAGIGQAWGRLSLSARVNLVLASLATVAVIAVLVAFGSRPQYVTLFDGLSPSDVTEIRTLLAERDVPYELRDGGQTVLVPLQHRSDLRVEILNKGLPKSQGSLPGFDIFDQPSLMTTQFQQDVNYQRAIQGTLQQMLSEFTFVNRAFVFIREAKDELFISEQKPSEAAVTLDVSRPLTRIEIKAILGIVSSFGGASLNPENITLTTTDGKPLHLPAQDEFEMVANTKQEHHLNWEREREKSAEEALAKFGVRSVVQVALNIDFSSIKEVTERVDKGAPVSTMTTTRTMTTRESLPEGPAGALVNLPEGAAVQGTETEETEEETIENLDTSHTMIEKVVGPGTVEAATVAAIVEGRYEPEVDADGNPTGQRAYVARTDEEIDTYRALLASAVGFGVKPEDVAVYDQPFDLEGLAVAAVGAGEAAGPQMGEMVLKYGRRPLQVLLVLAGFLVARALLLRSLVSPEAGPEEVGIELPAASPEEMRRREIANEVERLSQEEPDTVASLLRSWLSESEE